MIRWLIAAALVALPVAASAQGAPATIEARLRKVEDELAIRRILVDYAARLDGRDYKAYAALFTPDGEWANGAGSHKGREAIEKMLGMLGPAGAENKSNFHIITNPQVDVTGDTATAVSRYLFVMRGKDGRPVPSLAGIYTDSLVRDGAGWKIKRRVANDIMPSREEWARIIAAQNGQ